jgi:ABC-type lipoprotein release transport system permease subunit
VRARIVATSRNLALFALAVPLEFVDEMNTLFLPDREKSYSALMVTAERAEDVPSIVRSVEALGLRAETRRGIAQKAELLVGIVTTALSALALAILVSAVTSAVHTLVADIRSRKFAIGVLVALGTPWEKLAAVFSFQILFMSAISTIAGGLGGTLVAWGVSEALLSLSTVLRNALDSLAVFPAAWMAAGLVFVLAVSTGFAYLSFRRLLGQPVAELLRR